MGSSYRITRHVDPDIFKNYIKEKGLSIRQLGDYCNTTERTIRRMVNDQEVTLNVAIDLCNYFHCNFDDIFGPDESEQWGYTKNRILNQIR